MKRIWHISDTHTYHELLKVPENIDIVIFSGDCTIPKEPHLNEVQVVNFLDWFIKLPIKHKVFVAGNHDVSIERGYIDKNIFALNHVIYLENETCIIEGIKMWGSPITPTFGEGWAYNVARHKIGRAWENIPKDVDVLITHGPPKNILDLTITRDRELDRCGCKSLFNKVEEIKPKLHLFGHIHNCEDIINAGTKQIPGLNTIFSNGSVVTDRKFGQVTSNGNILEI